MEEHTLQTPTRRFQMFIILGLLSAFGPFSIDMYLPAFPQMKAQFAASSSVIQLSLTLFLIGLGIGQLIIGPISDKFGRRKMLLAGLFLYTFASFMCAILPSIHWFIGLRFLQGIGGAAGIVISMAIIRDLYRKHEMTKMLALVTIITGMGPILAPILGAVLISHFTWKSIFVLLTLFGLLMFVVVQRFLPETLRAENRSTDHLSQLTDVYKRLFQDRSYLSYVLPQSFVYSGLFAYISASSFVFQHDFSLSAQTYSLLFGLNGAALILFSQFASFLSKKYSEALIYKLSIVLSFVNALTLILFIFIHVAVQWIILCLVLIIGSMSAMRTVGTTLAMQDQAKSAGSAAALSSFIGLLLGAIAAPLTGLGPNETVSMGLVIFATSVFSILMFIFMPAKKLR